jgi:hypothetical protein
MHAKFRTIKFVGRIPLIISAIRVLKERICCAAFPHQVSGRSNAGQQRTCCSGGNFEGMHSDLSQVMPWHTFIASR